MRKKEQVGKSLENGGKGYEKMSKNSSKHVVTCKR